MMSAKTESVIFSIAEQRLLLIFYSGEISATVDALRQALMDIYDEDERRVTAELVAKLENMNEAALVDYYFESEGVYV